MRIKKVKRKKEISETKTRKFFLVCPPLQHFFPLLIFHSSEPERIKKGYKLQEFSILPPSLLIFWNRQHNEAIKVLPNTEQERRKKGFLVLAASSYSHMGIYELGRMNKKV